LLELKGARLRTLLLLPRVVAPREFDLVVPWVPVLLVPFDEGLLVLDLWVFDLWVFDLLVLDILVPVLLVPVLLVPDLLVLDLLVPVILVRCVTANLVIIL